MICRLRTQSFMTLGQTVRPVRVRTDTRTNFVSNIDISSLNEFPFKTAVIQRPKSIKIQRIDNNFLSVKMYENSKISLFMLAKKESLTDDSDNFYISENHTYLIELCSMNGIYWYFKHNE